MDKVLKSQSNRFVIEDSIPKVTSDGEPHEVMTIVAMGSGLIAAILVLVALVFLIGCRQQTSGISQNNSKIMRNTKKSSIKSIIPLFSISKQEIEPPQLLSITSISAMISETNGICHNGKFCNNGIGKPLTTDSLPGIVTIHC